MCAQAPGISCRKFDAATYGFDLSSIYQISCEIRHKTSRGARLTSHLPVCTTAVDLTCLPLPYLRALAQIAKRHLRPIPFALHCLALPPFKFRDNGTMMADGHLS